MASLALRLGRSLAPGERSRTGIYALVSALPRNAGLPLRLSLVPGYLDALALPGARSVREACLAVARP